MDAISERAAVVVVTKKSKKMKGRESAGGDGYLQVGDEGNKVNKTESLSNNTSSSKAVAHLVSCGDMNKDSNERKKQKDKSRKEKKEKNISGSDREDQVSDHQKEKNKKKNQMLREESACNVLEASNKAVHEGSEHIGFAERQTRKKKKITEKDRNNMNDENNTDTKADGLVGRDLKQVKERKEQAQEEGQLKKQKKKNKMMEPQRKEKSDIMLVKECEGKAREEDKVKKKTKKNKELKRNELGYAGEDQSFGRGGSVENQVDDVVMESVQPAPYSKRNKKKEEDLGAELLHDCGMHSFSGQENRGSSGSKKRKEKSGTCIAGDTNVTASVSTEWDCAAGDDEVALKVPSDKDKKTKKKKDKRESFSPNNEESSPSGGCKSKKEKSTLSNTERDSNAGSSKTNKRKKVTETSEKSTSSKKSKKVRFSGQDEVFSVPCDSSQGEKEQDGAGNGNRSRDGLIRGKRFSKEEDELVKKAVLDYIEAHQLGEEGIHMVMKCKAYPELKECWKEIGEALPWRPYTSVYYRAHILFERGEHRKWSEEELEFVRKFHEKHGANWKQLADELGKHRFHVKDTWRRIKLPNRKRGHWSQEEYQNLFDLVNMDLSMKAFQEKKSKHGMLRDNISWEAISEKLSTRSTPLCCYKWYYQLTSPLVAEGKWSDVDDYRLLIALVDLDAACEEDVDWDNLLEHRSGEICRKRWNQMVLHIGQHGIKPFNEQLEILSKRYCPDLLEAREAYANQPYVDALD